MSKILLKVKGFFIKRVNLADIILVLILFQCTTRALIYMFVFVFVLWCCILLYRTFRK